MTERTSLPAWQALRTHADEIGSTHLRDLFGNEAARFDGLHVEVLDFLYDFSRQRLTYRTIELLLELARTCRLEERIAALFAGAPVNLTENRAAMHMALRNRSVRPMLAAGRDVMPEVRDGLARMRRFVTGSPLGTVSATSSRTSSAARSSESPSKPARSKFRLAIAYCFARTD